MLDTSRGATPLNFVEGLGQIVPGLEKVLVAMQPGEQRTHVVPPEEAYGLREPEMIQRVPRSALPVEGAIAVGDQFQTGPDRGAPIVTVVGIEGDHIELDANHPLAGVTLHFDVELLAARAATPEELSAAAPQDAEQN